MFIASCIALFLTSAVYHFAETQVRDSIKPLFYTQMRLGVFDPPAMNPYSNISPSVIQSPEHQALAIEAAVKSFVLLKNVKNTLPLNTRFGKVAVCILCLFLG